MNKPSLNFTWGKMLFKNSKIYYLGISSPTDELKITNSTLIYWLLENLKFININQSGFARSYNELSNQIHIIIL